MFNFLLKNKEYDLIKFYCNEVHVGNAELLTISSNDEHMVKFSVNRLILNKENLFKSKAFIGTIVACNLQRWPFQIHAKDTLINNAWLESYIYAFECNECFIVEGLKIEFEAEKLSKLQH